MAFEKLTNNLKGLTDNGQELFKNSADYYKLKIFKHSMQALIGVATLTIRGIFGLVFILFMSIGVAVFLSEQFESASTGYFIVGGFYFIIFLMILLFAKKPMERMFLEKYSKMTFSKKALQTEQGVTLTNKSPDEDIL